MGMKNKDIRGSGGERLARIAALGELVFHTSDLANLWGISNKNTLNKTLSRYVADGLIHRVYKGLYAIKKPGEIDPFLLGVKESVLYKNGILNQLPQAVTLVSQFSRHFFIAGTQYRSRKMSDNFLFNDVGIEMKGGVRIASIPRAVADMLYFNPRKYFDAGDSGLIEWNKVREIANAVGYVINGIKSWKYDDINQQKRGYP